MSESKQKIILYLDPKMPSTPAFVVVQASGEILTDNEANRDLARVAIDKEVIVLVNAEDVLLTQVVLPKMPRARLLQALPFALEEQFIAELETLHFALGALNAEGAWPVAVVAHDKMRAWLQQLAEWQLTPSAMLPLSLALPVTPTTWSILIKDMALVRTEAYRGFACDLALLSFYLEQAFSEKVPEKIDIHTFTRAVPPALPVAYQHIAATLFSHAPEEWLAFLSEPLMTTPAINLLQGAYAVKQASFISFKKIKLAASIFAFAWVFLLFLYPTISYFILHQRAIRIESEITRIYKENFPQATSLVAPQLRMEEKWRKMQGQWGDSSFLVLMKKLAVIFNPTIKLTRLVFQNNQLQLEVTAANAADLSRFSEALSQQGLSVRQQNVHFLGAQMQAMVVIE